MAGTYDRFSVSTAATKAQPKRLVVCCDGTWQSGTTTDPSQGCQSNVSRLSRILAKAGVECEGEHKGREWQQIVYYDAGVGTGDITKAVKDLQGLKGLGLLENVLEAYNFIVCNYSRGDELFFFGFSRGAYTARSAAGIVQQIGIIHPYLMPQFLQCYGAYIRGGKFDNHFDKTDHWTKFTRTFKDPLISSPDETVIRVIGVWDTVGALGLPDVYDLFGWKVKDNSREREAFKFHNTDLGPCVKHAYQALALDELRVPFEPCLWHVAKDNNVTSLVQCWFPGAHINVGGGNSENADENHPQAEHLASVSYAWMLDRVRPWLAVDEKALEIQKESFLKTLGSSDWLLGKIDESYNWKYWASGLATPRKPTEYHNFKDGWTTERVHPTVWLRQKNEGDYEPKALNGWRRLLADGLGRDRKPRKGWMWVKEQHGSPQRKRWMWEFEVGLTPDSVERWLLEESGLVKTHWDKVELGWVPSSNL